MIRRGTVGPGTAELCPRCHAPHAAVRRAAGCDCALVACRCAIDSATVYLLDDPRCDGCVVQRLAWRLHLIARRHD